MELSDGYYEAWPDLLDEQARRLLEKQAPWLWVQRHRLDKSWNYPKDIELEFPGNPVLSHPYGRNGMPPEAFVALLRQMFPEVVHVSMDFGESKLYKNLGYKSHLDECLIVVDFSDGQRVSLSYSVHPEISQYEVQSDPQFKNYGVEPHIPSVELIRERRVPWFRPIWREDQLYEYYSSAGVAFLKEFRSRLLLIKDQNNEVNVSVSDSQRLVDAKLGPERQR